MGTQFMPIHMNALHLADVSAQTKIKCASQCSAHPQCRTFNFDTATQICQLFQGDTIATGSTVSAVQTSMFGSVRLMETFFTAYNRSCDQCADNRFLRCVNDTCQCQQNTYWNGSFCLPQLPLPCMECEPNRSMCREDLNLTCQSYSKCDYANQTCNITDAPTTDTTTEVYSTSTVSTGKWVLVGNMSIGRSCHTSTLIPSENDTVIIAGGIFTSQSTVIDKFVLSNLSIFACGGMSTFRKYHAAEYLNSSGYIIFTGGESNSSFTLESAELFNPISCTVVSSNLTMTSPRQCHTITTLPVSSKLFLVGNRSKSRSAELFDPNTLSFSVVNSTMNVDRYIPTSTLLPGVLSSEEGILISGGFTPGNPNTTFPEYYNASFGYFVMSPTNMAASRSYYTATLLSDPRTVLICGGFDRYVNYLDSCEIYNHISKNFSLITNHMSVARSYHTATLLQDGKVLIVGGYDGGTVFDSTELYDPASKTFTTGPSLNNARYLHTATLLPLSGNVLVCGGEDTANVLASCELYYR
ncbi:unnamed protein product [Adineta ricciae]|uniref:Apple domain-containing protein n=1 Tax=Adineta ricciae TaxID=249248 RepID=A0A813VLH5_ADIRI|nr:unnamed protein product [Adineta ricciae]CAF1009363.1 unnamed protein product [Adineta ricciae]